MPVLCFLLYSAVLPPTQEYEQQQQAASAQLAGLGQQFESAVADILGITAEQQPHLLAAAVKEQQQLQEEKVGDGHVVLSQCGMQCISCVLLCCICCWQQHTC